MTICIGREGKLLTHKHPPAHHLPYLLRMHLLDRLQSLLIIPRCNPPFLPSPIVLLRNEFPLDASDDFSRRGVHGIIDILVWLAPIIKHELAFGVYHCLGRWIRMDYFVKGIFGVSVEVQADEGRDVGFVSGDDFEGGRGHFGFRFGVKAGAEGYHREKDA